MKRLVVALTAVVVLAGCGSASRVDQVVDETEENGALARYCKAMEGATQLAISDEEAFAAFQRGYKRDDPPARDVFEEIRRRCDEG